MVLFSRFFPPPRIKIKEVHAVSPSTCIRIELLLDKGVREVHILPIPMKRSEACFDCSIHLPIHVNLSQSGKIPLYHNIVVQEKNLLQVWVHLRQVEPQVVEHREILGIPELHIASIFSGILKLILKIEFLEVR